jgi:N4-gp56 family major capsid protein
MSQAITPQLIAALPAALQTQYDRNLLKRALPELVYAKFGQKKPFKANSGQIIKFRRYNSLAVASALTEGTTPDKTDVNFTEVVAQIVQYGALCSISDKVSFTNQDALLSEISDILGEQMGLTVDTVLRNVLVGTTSVFWANGVAATNAVVTKIAGADLDRIHRAMRRNNVKYFKDAIIGASTGVGTAPIRPSYAVVVHPDVAYDLESITGFKYFSEYPGQGQVDPSEIGAYKNFRFYMSTNAYVEADAGGTAVTNGLKYTTANTACDVYHCLIFGKDSFGTIEFGPMTQSMIVSPPGTGDDYLKQRTIVGWKWTGANVITNDNNIYNYKCGCTA